MSAPVVFRAKAGEWSEAAFDPGPVAPDELLVAVSAIEVGGLGMVGRVVELGAELRGERERWIDRLVALPALRACGACLPCRRGHPAACVKRPSAPPLASHTRLAARLAVAFGEDLTAPEPASLLAALGGTALFAYAAVVRAGVEPNRAAIVLGRGPLAAMIAAWVHHRGAEPVRVDGVGDRERVADTLAAHGVEPFAVPVIDASDDAETACAIASPGAQVVLCGAGSSSPSIARSIAERGLSVHGLRGAHPDLLPEVCAFVSAGRFALGPLCSLVDRRAALGAVAGDERALIWQLA